MGKRICQRCGYCCLKSFVVIVKDPDLGPVDGNLKHVDGEKERCPHLVGDIPGEYACKIHDREWFQDTPCGQYNSDSFSSCDEPCRMGVYKMKRALGRR